MSKINGITILDVLGYVRTSIMFAKAYTKNGTPLSEFYATIQIQNAEKGIAFITDSLGEKID